MTLKLQRQQSVIQQQKDNHNKQQYQPLSFPERGFPPKPPIVTFAGENEQKCENIELSFIHF